MSGGASRRTERLMCFVFILKARGRRGITRAELRAAIEDYAACPTDAAFERMLERDKRDLRDIGVAIEVSQRDAWHEDEHAYVLSQQALAELPTFTPAELRVLGLAAEAWDRSTWEAVASGALRKVEVFGSEIIADTPARISLQHDRYLEPLRRAARQRQAVSFHYRRPGDRDPSLRHVEPWGLLHREGGWYCIGFDRERNASRVFRTSRISGDVTLLEAASSAVDPAWASVLETYFAGLEPLQVRLLIASGHGWSWRAIGTVIGQRTINGITYDIIDAALKERDGLIGELAAAAPHVLVTEPTDLRMRVIEHLQEVGRD